MVWYGGDSQKYKIKNLYDNKTDDDDTSETLSLGSFYILDLFTDDLVFEYTGRPMFADDFYEICRRACLFYNAELNYENNKKGLFKYFSQHNSLYLLSDTLEFLADKEIIIPIIKDWILEVNREEKFITMRLPEGLMDVFLTTSVKDE